MLVGIVQLSAGRPYGMYPIQFSPAGGSYASGGDLVFFGQTDFPSPALYGQATTPSGLSSALWTTTSPRQAAGAPGNGAAVPAAVLPRAQASAASSRSSGSDGPGNSAGSEPSSSSSATGADAVNGNGRRASVDAGGRSAKRQRKGEGNGA